MKAINSESTLRLGKDIPICSSVYWLSHNIASGGPAGLKNELNVKFYVPARIASCKMIDESA
jgi:hypothetical protein